MTKNVFGLPAYLLVLLGEVFLLEGGDLRLDSPRVLSTLVHPDLFYYPFVFPSPWLLGLGALLILGGLVLHLAGPGYNPEQRVVRCAPWKILAIILVLTLIALGIRLYHLNQLPWGLFVDEGFEGLDSRNIADGLYYPVFLTGNGGREPMFHYIQAVCLTLFGNTITAIRMVSVLAGTLCVPMIYLLGRRLFNARVGLFGAIFAAFSSWMLHFSRIGFRYILLTLFTGLAFWLFAEMLERRRWPMTLTAGLIMGLGLYTYVPFRLFPFVVGFYFLHRLTQNPGMLRQIWGQLLLFSVSCLIVISPLVHFFLHQSGAVMQRVNQTLVFPEGGLLSWDMLRLIGRGAAFFFLWGEALVRHNLPTYPAFGWFLATLWFVGLFLAIRGIRQPSMAILLVWQIVMLVPSIISVGNPSNARTIGAAAPAFLLIALAVDHFWNILNQSWPGRTLIQASVILALFSAGTTQELYHYFSEWPKIGHQVPRSQESLFGFSCNETVLARKLADRAPSVTVYLTPQLYLHPTIQFLGIGDERLKLLTRESVQSLNPASEKIWVIGEPQPRNLWWIRNSPAKNMFFWENSRKNLSNEALDRIIRESYGVSQPVIRDDSSLLQLVREQFPSASEGEMAGFACLVLHSTLPE